MCTSIVEITAASGMGKREDGWFDLSHAVVAYDHARHAMLDDCITIDFINERLDAGSRAAVELTLETAKALRDALDRAIEQAEFEETEVRGKGAPAAHEVAQWPTPSASPSSATSTTAPTRKQSVAA